MSDEIPYDKLGIPEALRPRLMPSAPLPARLAIARGLLPTTADVLLAMCYALALAPEPEVAAAARDTLANQPIKQLLSALSEKSHPKILEFLAEFRPPEDELDERLLRLRACNTRTIRLVAKRASAPMCEDLARNHERLIMSPEVLIDLHANPNATDAVVERAFSFLQLEGDPPELPPVRPFRVAEVAAPAPAAVQEAATGLPMDPAVEVATALRGRPSPALARALATPEEAAAPAEGGHDLGNFNHDFYDEADFDDRLLADYSEQGGADPETRKSLVQLIAAMNVTKKIKLAYLGNKEARAILIRDRIKSVPTAVIRSGRLTDGEVVMLAADRNLPRDVIRELSMSKEYVRKYPVQVALTNNPKTPIAMAMGFLKNMTKRDLQNLGRNKNISSALAQAAAKLSRIRD